MFRSEKNFRTTRELEYFFFSQNLTLVYMTKTRNRIIIFFLCQNQNIFLIIFSDVLCEVSMPMLLPYMLIFFDNERTGILFIFLQPWNLLTSWNEFTVPVVINFKWEYIYIFIHLFYNKILIYTGIYLLILVSLFVNVFGIL